MREGVVFLWMPSLVSIHHPFGPAAPRREYGHADDKEDEARQDGEEKPRHPDEDTGPPQQEDYPTFHTTDHAFFPVPARRFLRNM